MAGFLPQSAQAPGDASLSPSVSISLPDEVPSDSVQISYFLMGPFGGYGGYAPQRAGVHSYDIPTTVDRVAATEIRMIIYAPDCEIQQFDFNLSEHSKVSQQFLCDRVKKARLSGRIAPSGLVSDKNAELIVMYMAYWAHGFYGIVDGAVTEFHIATASPDANGMFQVELPCFSADIHAPSAPRRANFRLMLRDSKTWNPIASHLETETEEFGSPPYGLRIRSHYPDELVFTADPSPQLEKRIENALAAKEPDWKGVASIESARFPLVPSETRIITAVWMGPNSRSQDVFVEVYSVENPAEAAKWLEPVRDKHVAAGWQVSAFQIGDEGYMSKYKDGERYDIQFRLGTVVARIEANSLAMVKEFVQCIVEQVAKN